jgi:hypothetical protein
VGGKAHWPEVHVARPIVSTHGRFFTDTCPVTKGWFSAHKGGGHAWRWLSSVRPSEGIHDVVASWSKNAALQACENRVLSGSSTQDHGGRPNAVRYVEFRRQRQLIVSDDVGLAPQVPDVGGQSKNQWEQNQRHHNQTQERVIQQAQTYTFRPNGWNVQRIETWCEGEVQQRQEHERSDAVHHPSQSAMKGPRFQEPAFSLCLDHAWIGSVFDHIRSDGVKSTSLNEPSLFGFDAKVCPEFTIDGSLHGVEFLRVEAPWVEGWVPVQFFHAITSCR